MKIKHFVLHDSYDYTDEFLIVLENETEDYEIQNIVNEVKEKHECDWTYEDILNAIDENLDVLEIYDIAHGNIILM
jgi:spore coat polysaccharide biosynthesis protein SpsF (cytidylyltransferase family)